MKRFLSACVLATVASLAPSFARATDDDKDSAFTLPARPAAAPTTKPAAQAKVSPEARKVLDDVKAAYAALTSLELTGTVSFDADIAGKPDTERDEFTAAFEAPNKFRHEMKGNMLAGSTGAKAYAISLEENTYVQKDAPKDRVASGEGPAAIWDVLVTQNPSLAMAIARDPAQQLIDGAVSMTRSVYDELSADDLLKQTSVDVGPEVTVGDAKFPSLKLTLSLSEFTFAIDPATHLLRQVVVDQRKLFEKAGQPDVKRATLTFDYTAAKPGAKAAADLFAWAPPANARELTAPAAPRGAGGSGEAESALLGKPAPAFKLAGLDGKDVSLADAKGSVVIVDFWATWCGPCVASLPHLNKLYDDKKEAGLKVFAVSVDEDKAKVPPFVDEKKLTLKVLYDNDEQKAAEKYGVTGIPQTVVIGKDGVVKKVFVGFGPGGEEALAKIVDAELAK